MKKQIDISIDVRIIDKEKEFTVVVKSKGKRGMTYKTNTPPSGGVNFFIC